MPCLNYKEKYTTLEKYPKILVPHLGFRRKCQETLLSQNWFIWSSAKYELHRRISQLHVDYFHLPFLKHFALTFYFNLLL